MQVKSTGQGDGGAEVVKRVKRSGPRLSHRKVAAKRKMKDGSAGDVVVGSEEAPDPQDDDDISDGGGAAAESCTGESGAEAAAVGEDAQLSQDGRGSRRPPRGGGWGAADAETRGHETGGAEVADGGGAPEKKQGSPFKVVRACDVCAMF